MKTSELQFTTPQLIDVEFTINEDFIEGIETELAIVNNISVFKKDGEKVAFVKLEMIIGDRTNKYPYFIKITEAANFRWENDIPNIDNLLKKNGSALLISYIRPIVASITGSTKYGSFHIPFMDVSNMN